MAATTTLLGLVTPTQGTLSGTWGDTVNYGISDYVDIAIAGTLSFAGDGAITLANTTGSSAGNGITSTTAQYMIIRVTGTQTVTKVITGPSYSKMYMVDHAGATSAVTFKASGQTGVSIAVGEKCFVYYNGTDYVKAASSVVSALTGTLPVANGGTGQTSYTDGQLLIGNTTGNTLTKTTLTAGSNITITNGSGAITIAASSGASAATPTALGTVYGITPAGTAAVALGYQAATTNTSATGVTAIGYQAGQNNTSNNVTAIGYQAGQSNTGTANTFVGIQSGVSNTSGTQNSSFGQGTFGANTTGSNNVAIGRDSLQANTTASDNTAVGYQSLYSNTTGSENAALSGGVLRTNTTGSNNTAAGYNALYANTTGLSNSAFGRGALLSNTTADNNSAFGKSAMFSNTTGTSNVSVGFESLYSNTTATGNTAVGNKSLRANTTGDANSAFGDQCLLSNTTAIRNTAVGHRALAYATTGGQNTAVGYYAAEGTTGIGNVCVGDYAGVFITTGGDNICIGKYAGYNSNVGPLTTGGQNILIGVDNGLGSSSDNYTIVVGQGRGKGGSTGFINPNTGGVYQGNNSSSWSTTSDQRLKKNIVDNNVGLTAINSIRVRNFEYRVEDEITELPTHAVIKKSGVQLGVIAQELQAVLPECVKQESTGVLSVDTDNLTWYMINAIKELKAEFDAYKLTHP